LQDRKRVRVAGKSVKIPSTWSPARSSYSA
jgi:hypothetical protein